MTNRIWEHQPNRRDFLRNLVLGAAAIGLPRFLTAAEGGDRKPNILVILTDDQGYADISCNPLHPSEVSTPNMDALAASGVRFTNGYTSGVVCSPTRAGLMTGRYQQRFGIYTAGAGGSGVPLGEVFFPQYLKKAGYVSGAFGKWHLGLTEEYSAVKRGFDEFYGFMGRGAHDYFKLDNPDSPIYRGLDPFMDHGYLTNRLTDEAISFIQRHAPKSSAQAKPFFCYLAYNAVHSPAQAPQEDIAKYHNPTDSARNVLMAMLLHLDNGIGKVIAALKSSGVYENTLVFFLTDNGGSKAMHAINTPLHGFKTETYEGGIRVPFAISWPGRLPAGTTCDTPVISFDILPTALAAAGVPLPEKPMLDGKNMLPAAEGQVSSIHDFLCWNNGGGRWAIRRSDWKLFGIQGKTELYNLKDDISETKDVSAAHPEIVKELRQIYERWLDEMAEPISSGYKRWTPAEAEKDKKVAERKKQKGKKVVEEED